MSARTETLLEQIRLLEESLKTASGAQYDVIQQALQQARKQLVEANETLTEGKSLLKS